MIGRAKTCGYSSGMDTLATSLPVFGGGASPPSPLFPELPELPLLPELPPLLLAPLLFEL